MKSAVKSFCFKSVSLGNRKCSIRTPMIQEGFPAVKRKERSWLDEGWMWTEEKWNVKGEQKTKKKRNDNDPCTAYPVTPFANNARNVKRNANKYVTNNEHHYYVWCINDDDYQHLFLCVISKS